MIMRPSKKEKSYFSKRLIDLRNARGMTQEQLASALSVSLGTVSYYESKATNPKTESLNKLAEFFFVPVDFFMEKSSQGKRNPGPNSKLDLKIEELRKLSDAKQKLACDMLDMIIKGSQVG